MAQSSIAVGEFADTELTNYGPRWEQLVMPLRLRAAKLLQEQQLVRRLDPLPRTK